MLNIVLPMAGKGSRFANAGYELPKPFIQINGKPMIQVVVENLRPRDLDHRFIFICQKKHLDLYKGRELLRSIAPNCIIVEIDYYTQGQLNSALLAKEFINDDSHLLTANTDQYIDFNFSKYLSDLIDGDLDGSILTMEGNDPKWSYAEISENDKLVVRTAEKTVISKEATVGVYYFRNGSDFCWAAEETIRNNETVNGEFYICPIYNKLIERNQKIGYCRINGMYGLGTPEDLDMFLANKISRLV